jgi:hypothetical protein
MKKSSIRPAWWFLYLSIALVLGLFWIEAKLPFSTTGHTWAEVGLVFILFGLVMVWLNSNEAGLISEEWERYKKTTCSNAVDIPQTRRSKPSIRKDDSCPHDPNLRLEGRSLPAWLIPLASLITAIFKIQDQ